MKKKVITLMLLFLMASLFVAPLGLAAGADPSDLKAINITPTSIRMTWSDNVTDEDYYRISRKIGNGSWTVIKWHHTGGPDYTDTGLTPITTYSYQVQAIKEVAGVPHYDQNPSNILTVTTPIDPTPTNLQATATGTSSITLTWQSNVPDADYYRVDRRLNGGNFDVIQWHLPGNTNNWADTGLQSSTTYIYRVYAIKMVNGNPHYYGTYSNEASATTQSSTPPPSNQTILKFYIGSTEYYVNGQVNTMDAAPLILEGRTLLPITYAATPLGVSINWNPGERKVTLNRQGSTIELWIDQSLARVNGQQVYIDAANPNVAPRVMGGRTMLPIGFIALNLNCAVSWNPNIKEVKVTYPKP